MLVVFETICNNYGSAFLAKSFTEKLISGLLSLLELLQNSFYLTSL